MKNTFAACTCVSLVLFVLRMTGVYALPWWIVLLPFLVWLGIGIITVAFVLWYIRYRMDEETRKKAYDEIFKKDF